MIVTLRAGSGDRHYGLVPQQIRLLSQTTCRR